MVLFSQTCFWYLVYGSGYTCRHPPVVHVSAWTNSLNSLLVHGGGADVPWPGALISVLIDFSHHDLKHGVSGCLAWVAQIRYNTLPSYRF